MTTRWSRRGFLAASGTAVALGLPLQASAVNSSAVSAEAANEFTALRAKWRTLILGEGFSPTLGPFKSRLAELGSTASQCQFSMAPAAGSLWPAVISKPSTVTSATTGSALKLTFGDLSTTKGATQRITVRPG